MGEAAQAPWLHVQDGHVLLDVLVSPRASRTRTMGVHDGRFKIQLAAPPTDGQANAALVRFIAKALKLSRAQVEIVGGAASRRKTVRVAEVSAEKVLWGLTSGLRSTPVSGKRAA